MVSASEFSTNFVVLRAEKASFCDLLCFLLFGYTGKEGEEAFIECPMEKKEQNLGRRCRWFILLSLLRQKICICLKIPMKLTGFVVEWLLNLPSTNQNLCHLLLNLLQGQVVMPDRESATFMTFSGLIDQRVKLDNSIKQGDDKYYRALSAMAAKIAYENKAFIKTTVTRHWKMELIDFYKFWNVFERKYTATAYMVVDKKVDPEMVVVAFRGTEIFNADLWAIDMDISWYEYPGMGIVHGSFLKALGLQENGWPQKVKQDDHHPLAYYTIRNQLKNLVSHSNKTKFIITGHSAGGALAILFTAVLALHGEALLLERLEGVYTFGQPMIGDDVFGDFMEEKLQLYDINYQRIVYNNDLAPTIKDPAVPLKHFGTCLYYNCLYKGKKILKEDEQPKEISKFAIFKFLSAVLELMRGFIIPYIKGPEYSESCLLKAIRVVGLILPGYVTHNMYDYVNVTRLGWI